MRKSLPTTARRFQCLPRPPLNALPARHNILSLLSPCGRPSSNLDPPCHLRCHNPLTAGTRPLSTFTAKTRRSNGQTNSKSSWELAGAQKEKLRIEADYGNAVALLSKEARQRPLSWVKLFDEHLPLKLRSQPGKVPQQDVVNVVAPLDLHALANVVRGARSFLKLEIFEWMIDNGHKEAAVWLIEQSLKFISAHHQSQELPSNVQWPTTMFGDDGKWNVRYGLDPQSTSARNNVNIEDTIDEQFRSPPIDQQQLLNTIWSTLGRLVLRAADTVDGATSEQMTAVHLILGHIHNLNMMPKDFYSYTHDDSPGYVKKIPLLHLVSSRILTTLSDAAWREQQKNAIRQAAETGMTLREISNSVPGGRFNLKVRPLGPEIWLELILWACAEGGHYAAASRIINELYQKSDDPWFALAWRSAREHKKFNVRIDWDRIKQRHGGTVGLIEGYSRTQPFVDVPARTISVEVTLALVETMFNSCSTHTHAESIGLSVSRTQQAIEQLVTFLEPHDLGPDYFDYLESRLVQVGAFDPARAPGDLHTWSSRLTSLRRLTQLRKPEVPKLDLSLESVQSHSLLHVGLKQQTLDNMVQLGDIHNSLAVFNDIQEQVDEGKSKSIMEFLRTQPIPEADFFTTRPFKYRLEYADSHGQLPLYKLAGFLNLLSETGLIGLGQWLLYADEIDGALIPESAYELPCMAASLVKFAAASKDMTMLKEISAKARVSEQINTQNKLSTIRLLRSIFNADLSFLKLLSATRTLSRLRKAQGGGWSTNNLTHLIGVILRFEKDLVSVENKEIIAQRLDYLLRSMLDGSFNCAGGDFTQAQKVVYRQQISQVLRVCAQLDNASLQKIAKRYAENYRSGNVVSLPVRDFNVLLSATADSRGSVAAYHLWQMFCASPGTEEPETYTLDDDPIPIVAVSDQDVNHNEPNTNSSDFVSSEAHDDEQDPFDDPFFQDPKEVSQDKGAGSGLAALLEPRPITTPNLQSLRIILRAAIEELKVLPDKDRPKSQQQEIITWARSTFKLFGIRDKNTIAQEFQEPVSELDEDTEEYVKSPEIKYFRDQETGRFERDVGSTRVSQLWVPQRQFRKIQN